METVSITVQTTTGFRKYFIRDTNLSSSKPQSLKFVLSEGLRLNNKIEDLTFYNCKIPIIIDKFFSPFPDLTKIVCSYISVEEIHDDIFAYCKGLQHIDLSNNKIKFLNANMFNRNLQLTFIDLSNNQLEKLPNMVFQNVQSLKTLLLGGNSLQYIDADCFNGLINLRELQLQSNYLMELDVEEIVENIPGLYWININNNNFLYDRLLEVVIFLKNMDVCYGESFTKNSVQAKQRNYRVLHVDGIACVSERTYRKLFAERNPEKTSQEIEKQIKRLEKQEKYSLQLYLEMKLIRKEITDISIQIDRIDSNLEKLTDKLCNSNEN